MKASYFECVLFGTYSSLTYCLSLKKVSMKEEAVEAPVTKAEKPKGTVDVFYHGCVFWFLL